jgi:hypothetical protein
MKNQWHKSIVFGVFLFAVLGCSLVGKIKEGIEKSQKPQVLTGTDGKFQLTVPGNWRTETVMNDVATLQASNRFSELYTVVIRESKEDISEAVDLDYYTEIVRGNLQKAATDVVMAEPVAVSINGYNARQFEASATVQNVKAKYIYAVLETPQGFYQIITWTLTSRYEKGKETLINVINSFKEINDGEKSLPPPPPPPPPAVPKKNNIFPANRKS